MSKRRATDKPGVITQGAVYGLNEFKQRTGISDWALRQARRQGLKVRRVGNTSYVRGDDFIHWLIAQEDSA
ncbi:MAG: hypothetical protein WDZ59_03400 [Pirellulales bacterium]